MKALCSALCFLCVGVAVGQAPGRGIAKYTMACTDPNTALVWAIKYFPVIDCTATGGNMCNGTDECGRIGRTNLCASDDCPQASGPGTTLMFPHLINATARPYGKVSITEVEAQFSAKFANAVSTLQYDSFLDLSLVVYAKSLDKWLAPLKADGFGFFPIAWKDEEGKSWWSAVVNIPHTQVLVEMISDTKPSSVETFFQDGLVRLPATKACTQNSCSAGTEGTWVPLAVSKAVVDAEVQDFYTGVFEGQLGFNSSDSESKASVQMVYFNGYVDMQVRLVRRPAAATTAGFSVSDLQEVKMDGHRSALGRNESESALCGISKWYDNHWGLDQSAVSFSDYLKNMEKRGWNLFHLYSWNMYVVDPSGDAVQLDASWGTYKPSWVAKAEGDSLMNLCSQGVCDAATAPTCAAELKSKCADLGGGGSIADCASCIHWNHEKLLGAECFNADFVNYCGVPSFSSS